SAAGSSDDVKGGRVEPGRSSSCHVVHRGCRETESTPRVRASAQFTPNPSRGRGERGWSMNCKDVARALSEESRLPLQAKDHVGSCNRCQELVSATNIPVAVDTPSQETLRQIAEGMATNLRPVRPMAPARYFFVAFVGVFVSIVAL